MIQLFGLVSASVQFSVRLAYEGKTEIRLGRSNQNDKVARTEASTAAKAT
jgi:hypothetical protein